MEISSNDSFQFSIHHYYISFLPFLKANDGDFIILFNSLKISANHFMPPAMLKSHNEGGD